MQQQQQVKISNLWMDNLNFKEAASIQIKMYWHI
jgi:hypothetical protein